MRKKRKKKKKRTAAVEERPAFKEKKKENVYFSHQSRMLADVQTRSHTLFTRRGAASHRKTPLDPSDHTSNGSSISISEGIWSVSDAAIDGSSPAAPSARRLRCPCTLLTSESAPERTPSLVSDPKSTTSGIPPGGAGLDGGELDPLLPWWSADLIDEGESLLMGGSPSPLFDLLRFLGRVVPAVDSDSWALLTDSNAWRYWPTVLTYSSKETFVSVPTNISLDRSGTGISRSNTLRLI